MAAMTAQQFLEKKGWSKDDKGMFDYNGLKDLLSQYSEYFLKIGKTPVKEISQDDLLEICKIEGVHNVFDYNGEQIWGQPTILDFSKTLFHDTIVIDYQQKRILDGIKGNVIVLFLNHEDFSYHWHFKGGEIRQKSSKRLKLESIKYLIDKGYKVPLF